MPAIDSFSFNGYLLRPAEQGDLRLATNVQINCVNGGTPTLTSSTGALNANCPLTVTSDYRVKKNVETLDAALPLVSRLRPVSFDYVDSFASDGKRHVGFLAHELQTVLPGSVVGEKDALTEEGENQMQSIQLWDLVAVLTRAVQELSVKVDQLSPQPQKDRDKVAST